MNLEGYSKIIGQKKLSYTVEQFGINVGRITE
jgi:hypothetical protein